MKSRILLLFAAALLAGCGGQRPQSESKPGASTVAKVQKVSPQRKELVRVVEQPGTVQAYEETPLYARLAGYVKKFHKLIGDKVNPGDVLAEISIPELVEESNQKEQLVKQALVEVELARKNLATAEAHVTAVAAQVKVAESALTRAQASYERWQSEHRRMTKYVADKVLERQTLDETLNQFKAAEATRDETRAQIIATQALEAKSVAEKNRAEVDVMLAQAREHVAKAEARRVAELVKYTRVPAPYAGVVTKRNVDTGHFVQPADSGRAVPLYTVVRRDKVLVVIYVPELDAVLVRERQPVTVTVQALGGRAFLGTVSRTSWALEPGTRTMRAEIDLENPQDELRSGMYVYARVTTKLPPAWVLPAAAVVKQGDQLMCFRVEGTRVVRTPVQVGHSDGESVQVLRWQKTAAPVTWAEFSEGMTVAAKAKGLTDGQTVEVAGR